MGKLKGEVILLSLIIGFCVLVAASIIFKSAKINDNCSMMAKEFNVVSIDDVCVLRGYNADYAIKVFSVEDKK